MIFINHMKILYRKKTRAWSFVYLVGTSVALLVLITAVRPSCSSLPVLVVPYPESFFWQHVLFQVIEEVTNYANPQEKFSSSLNQLGAGLYVGVTLVADAFLVRLSLSLKLFQMHIMSLFQKVYRTFIVLGGNYIVAIPFFVFLADIGAWP